MAHKRKVVELKERILEIQYYGAAYMGELSNTIDELIRECKK